MEGKTTGTSHTYSSRSGSRSDFDPCKELQYLYNRLAELEWYERGKKQTLPLRSWP